MSEKIMNTIQNKVLPIATKIGNQRFLVAFFDVQSITNTNVRLISKFSCNGISGSLNTIFLVFRYPWWVSVY